MFINAQKEKKQLQLKNKIIHNKSNAFNFFDSVILSKKEINFNLFK